MTLAVITIHGTTDASPSDHWDAETDKWWQIDSPFLNNFVKEISGNNVVTKIYPFHWSGLNSQNSRRDASLNLIRFVSNITPDVTSIVFIAHSHGGTVLIDAMDMQLDQYPLENISSTPLNLAQ